MVRKNKLAALLIGIALSAVAYAGLETVTHIQDLNASWPLGSDLASTSDDHVRNIKSALKTDFPNFNGTYTSASLPVFAIPSDANTGMYSVAADDLGFSTGGTLRFDISTTAFTGTLPWRGQDGLVGTPAVSFSGDTDNGMYRIGTDNYAFAAGGTRMLMFDQPNKRIVINGGSSSADNAFVVNNFAANASFFNVRGDGQAQHSDGTASAPGASFLNDTDTGFYRDTNNQIGVALAGVTAGQIAQGTFTGTLTGYAANPTGTVNYQRVGKIVTLWITSAITGTSNATTMTMTGLPAVIQTASAVSTTCTGFRADVTTGASSNVGLGWASINVGTMTFNLITASGVAYYQTGANNFANTGTKGLDAGWTCTYPVS